MAAWKCPADESLQSNNPCAKSSDIFRQSSCCVSQEAVFVASRRKFYFPSQPTRRAGPTSSCKTWGSGIDKTHARYIQHETGTGGAYETLPVGKTFCHRQSEPPGRGGHASRRLRGADGNARRTGGSCGDESHPVRPQRRIELPSARSRR